MKFMFVITPNRIHGVVTISTVIQTVPTSLREMNEFNRLEYHLAGTCSDFEQTVVLICANLEHIFPCHCLKNGERGRV